MTLYIYFLLSKCLLTIIMDIVWQPGLYLDHTQGLLLKETCGGYSIVIAYAVLYMLNVLLSALCYQDLSSQGRSCTPVNPCEPWHLLLQVFVLLIPCIITILMHYRHFYCLLKFLYLHNVSLKVELFKLKSD